MFQDTGEVQGAIQQINPISPVVYKHGIAPWIHLVIFLGHLREYDDVTEDSFLTFLLAVSDTFPSSFGSLFPFCFVLALRSGCKP